jgi:hypothetical protein
MFRVSSWLGCIECGVGVDAEVWVEELGFCIPCQAAYFDHSDDVSSAPFVENVSQ